MRIPGFLPISAPDARSPASESAIGSRASFGTMLEAAQGAPTPVRSTPAPSGIDPILLAEIGRIAQDDRDARARSRATELLRALGALQRALLARASGPPPLPGSPDGPSAGGSSDSVPRLARLLAEPWVAAQDPALAAVVASIRLRAEIELARADPEAS